MKKQNIPNLFIVWAPKCWTTSLHYYLSQHPDIYMSEPKEPHYFCSDLHKEKDLFNNKKQVYEHFLYRDKESYLNIFNQIWKKIYYWEASVLYLYSRIASKNIYDFNPNSKIIICLREPIDFLISLHQQLLSTKHENRKNFLKALELEKNRKDWIDLPSNRSIPSLLYYSEIKNFSEQINRYLKYFPTENIKVILFDDLKKNTKWVTENIINNFLHLNLKNNINYNIINKAKIIRFRFIRDIATSKYVFTIFKKILPQKVYNYIRDYIIEKLTIVNKKLKHNIPEEKLNKLKNECVIEVKKLNNILHKYNLIDKDINLVKLWWYDKY